MDAKLFLILALAATPVLANNSYYHDPKIKTVENSFLKHPDGMTTGFIINDEQDTGRLKLETTYNKKYGSISVRTTGDDGKDKVMSMDLASQDELDQQISNVQSNVNSQVDHAYDFIFDNSRKNTEQDNRMAVTEQELYATSTRSMNNSKAISQNKDDINTLFDEVDRIDNRMDGIIASSHAITNSRPYLRNGGDAAIGVGVGFSGHSEAISIGAAYAFTDNFSTSLTVSTINGEDSEVSGGAGVQLSF